MNEQTICEKCGAVMMPFKEFGSTGMKCPSCGWGWATTYQDPIDLDEQVYTIFIPPQDASMEAIKCISYVFSVNYIEARKNLQSGSLRVSGNARDIRNKAARLTESSVVYKIEPDFPHV